MTIWKLPPIFDDGRGTYIENSTRFEARGVQRQDECFAEKAVLIQLAEVAQFARPIRDASRPLRCRWGLERRRDWLNVLLV